MDAESGTYGDVILAHYRTHLVKFFSFLPPMGHYASIQFYLLQKR